MKSRVIFERGGNVLDSLDITLQAYLFLEENARPAGRLSVKPEPHGPLRLKVTLILRRKGEKKDLWKRKFYLEREMAATPFQIEKESLFQGGGYFELFVQENRREPVLAAYFGVVGSGGKAKSTDVRKFLEETMRKIERFQSFPLRLDASVLSLPTGDHLLYRSYLSLGSKDSNGKHHLFDFPGMPWTWRSSLLDLRLANQLGEMGAILKDKRMSDLFRRFTKMLAAHGFDSRSGLGYFGQECGLDLRTLGPVPSPNFPFPKFKPFNQGVAPALPEAELWRCAPRQMERMMRSMFVGLITDPGNMDYNRFCAYNFDSEHKEPVRQKDSNQCAFESIGARMILWWLRAWRETGDALFRKWAEKMLLKWEAVQHPQTGLIPNMFGGGASDPGGKMSPGEWASSQGGATACRYLAEASAMLKNNGGDPSLQKRLAKMALRLAHGILDHAYVRKERYFRAFLCLNGKIPREVARYAFVSEAQKAKAMRGDPRLAGVSVYPGGGLYRHPGYWAYCAGTEIPVDLALVATELGDETLSAKLQALTPDFDKDREETHGAITKDGRWRFTATAYHILFLIEMFRQRGGVCRLKRAAEIADEEITALGELRYPDWWRIPERSEFLWALLQLLKIKKGG